MADAALNHFGETEAAGRYARYRPYVHPLIVARIAAATGRVGAALDVGCGTGQSSRALLDMADEVTGADISAAMLAHAPKNSHSRFVQAPAERLPFADATFDLVASGLAFHWFDEPAFLAEARRLLRPGGWLAIYNDGFPGEMGEHAAYRDWHEKAYFERYPTPPRNQRSGGDGQWARAGFRHDGRQIFEHDVTLGLADWVGYLTTQSNVIAALERGEERVEGAMAWLECEIAPFFGKDAIRTFKFACCLDLYRAEAPGVDQSA